MKIKDEVIGREVLDSTGHKIGEVEDVDVDFKSDRVDSLVLHEGGRFRGRENNTFQHGRNCRGKNNSKRRRIKRNDVKNNNFSITLF